MVPDYDQVIFNYYDRLVPTVAEVLPHLADNRRADQAYFRHLLASGTPEDAEVAWASLGKRSFREDRLAAEYLDALLKRKLIDKAVEVWAAYLGTRRGEYPDSNLIFNGDFENDPTGAVFDWRTTAAAGTETIRDGSCAESGHWSLRITFRGVGNLNHAQTAQTVCLRAGEYVLRGYARTMKLSEGIRFHIFDPESSERLDVYTEQLTGTNDWTQLEKRFRVPAGTSLGVVQICRVSSPESSDTIHGEA